MEKKKLIRLAIFVVIIISGLIIIENLVRGVGKLIENKKENDRLEEQKNKYENSQAYKEEVMLEGVIKDFVELLNNNDIEKLYSLIELEYRDYKFENDINKFKEYINNYVDSNSEITLQTYDKRNGRYVCRLLSNNNIELKSFVAVIKEKEDGTYNIIFDNITGIEKITERRVNSIGIECEINYIITAPKTCIYNVKYTNLSGKDINYTYDNVILSDTFGNRFLGDIKNLKIVLKNGESVRQDLIFYNDEIHIYPKTYLDINLKNEQNNIKGASIYLGSDM